MNKLKKSIFKPIENLSKFPVQLLVTVLIFSTMLGCEKNSAGAIKIVEGIVFEDCDGNVCSDKNVILQYISSSSWSTEILSTESIITDKNGYYKFEYREAIDEGSSIGYYYLLSIPNSSIGISNPSGNLDLFPNDTLMNAIINLKFDNRYTSSDTFYYHLKPSSTGFLEEPEKVQYFTGPFQDTTIKFKDLRIANTNSQTKGQGYCGQFKWGIGIRRLNSNYTGKDGNFPLTHEPCSVNDRIDYLANPI